MLKAFAKDPADIKKLRVHISKAKGVAFLGSETQPATQEIDAIWPSSMRINWQFGSGDKQHSIIQSVVDDRGWHKETNMGVEKLDVEKLNDLRADAYAIWTASLTTLTEGQPKLSLAAPTKINGVPVVGLKVSRRSFPTVTLYFDQKTLLLRKMEYRNRNAGVNLKMEMFYDGHKDFGGLMLPTKQNTVIQGKKLFDWSEITYTFPEKIESKIFEKP